MFYTHLERQTEALNRRLHPWLVMLVGVGSCRFTFWLQLAGATVRVCVCFGRRQ